MASALTLPPSLPSQQAMRSSEGMWCSLMLKRDLLPTNTSTGLYRRFPHDGKCMLPTLELHSDLTCCPGAPWHTGWETQINKKMVTAASSQTTGNLKTTTEKIFWTLSEEASVGFLQLKPTAVTGSFSELLCPYRKVAISAPCQVCSQKQKSQDRH